MKGTFALANAEWYDSRQPAASFAGSYCGARRRIVLQDVLPLELGGADISDNMLPLGYRHHVRAERCIRDRVGYPTCKAVLPTLLWSLDMLDQERVESEPDVSAVKE